MKTSSTDLNRLLDDFEDYLVSGYRQPHPERRLADGGAGVAAGSVRPSPAEAEAANGTPGAPPSPPLSESALRAAELSALCEQMLACTRCALYAGRTHAVPGEGALDPLVMVVGEGPGAEEDSSGRPFVGRAGQYLDRWLAAISLSRTTNAYIANVVKCRPPGNRDPLPEESNACFPYLERQIELVRPKAILAVGRIAARRLVGEEAGVGRLRGRVYTFKGLPVVLTYHPSGVLRNQALRAPVWEDLKLLKGLLDEKGQT